VPWRGASSRRTARRMTCWRGQGRCSASIRSPRTMTAAIARDAGGLSWSSVPDRTRRPRCRGHSARRLGP
jgi:hypothetical protein